MRNVGKKSIIFFIISILICIPFLTETLAADKTDQMYRKDLDPGRMTFDLLLIRPAGILGTALGIAVYIVSLPFSGPGGNHELAYEKLVKDPAIHTFKRPLGEF
jgi:hypothetical protein